MSKHRAMALFVVTLAVALLGAAGAGDPHDSGDGGTVRAAAALPAVRF